LDGQLVLGPRLVAAIIGGAQRAATALRYQRPPIIANVIDVAMTDER